MKRVGRIKKLIEKCRVWQWKLYSAEIEWKKWDYAIVSKSTDIQKILWTVSVALDKNKNIILIKNYRHAIDAIVWELPRWGMEPEITYQQNAVKEFHEEIWIFDTPLNVKDLWIISPDSWLLWDFVKIVLLEYEDFSKYDIWWEKDGTNEGIYEVKYFSIQELENMIKEWEIVDGFTLSAYSLLKINWCI